jgi:hypothetical protein
MSMSRCVPLLAVFMAVAALGCSNSATRPVPVVGVIRLEGEPLPGVLIEFIPDAYRGTKGLRASALSDADGRFKLVYDDQRPGAVPGLHRVMVTDPQRRQAPQGSDEPPQPGRISFAYQDLQTTPLVVEVPPAGDAITLELSKDPQRGAPPRREGP